MSEITKDFIPTLEQMEELYKKEKRKEASENFYKNKVKVESLFFEKYRKFEKNKKYNFEIDNKYYEKYKKYVNEELSIKKSEIEKIEDLIAYERFFLNWERKINLKSGQYTGYGSSSATRYRTDRIKELENDLKNLISGSKEAWEYYYTRQLKDDIKRAKSNKLINVSYVADSKEKIMQSLEKGIPVYLVGHLGSGKTQLATESAIEYTINTKIQLELEEIMEEWFLKNQNSEEQEAILKFSKEYRRIKQHYENIILTGSKDEIEKLQPLFISGSHNLTYEDMFVEKTLVLSHSFSKGSFADYLEMIIGDFYQWMDSHRDKLDKMTEEEQLNLKIQIWKSFSDLLVAKNSAFGTEVKKIEREILKAVKEGRVVIIDELNTIAMQNLIALNDILQKNIGSKAYITGVGPVRIKEGFGLIGTGNLSTEKVNYEGTNELNPAFKSRFLTVQYNYLSQNIIGSLKEQNNIENNELFRVIISRLLDSDGNLHIPAPEETLEELFRLAQLSKVTQNVFMGKWKDNELSEEENIDDIELRESVLSIRNIIHVLDSWNMGEEKDLSKALWDSFISTITYADDENYILSQAVRFGFFTEENGWNIKTKAAGDSTTTFEEIRKIKYRYERPETDTLSSLDIIEKVFPKRPKYKEVPEKLKKEFKEIIDFEGKISIKEYQTLDRKLSKLEHSVNILEYLEDKED